ncbi:hypothetical protein CROQUDRAFT_98255 [Cronartium quercuum f. sp. fusiforme G11]|uniref:Uncharacterized protein n=1 Tax=Cronartium quercuum f. sp. fusiforme G11 TaxID=708437 RepID=A0A9P6T8T7_9BASI|nr:hypothetical protein CROQUDRAFT_98255 [Cronartium quercuum f. sp. fusiforme G11]
MLVSEDVKEVENIHIEIVMVLKDQVNYQSAFTPEGRQLVAETHCEEHSVTQA